MFTTLIEKIKGKAVELAATREEQFKQLGKLLLGRGGESDKTPHRKRKRGRGAGRDAHIGPDELTHLSGASLLWFNIKRC